MHASTLLPSAHVDTFARDHLPPIDEWPEIVLAPPYTYPARVNVGDVLLDRAVACGDGHRIAIVYSGPDGSWHELTYAELQQQVNGLAHLLVQELGILPGHRVLLRGYNGPTMAALWLAVMKAGAIAVTTMPLLRAGELREVMDRSRCTVALTDTRLAHELTLAVDGMTDMRIMTWGDGSVDDLLVRAARHQSAFVAVQTSSDDVCLIAFTSGSTGVPKGCLHFHRDVLAMCDGFSAQVLELTAADRCIGTPPLAFTFGLGGMLCFPMAVRASTVLIERCAPDVVLDAIAATKATVTFTAPTFYRQMARAIDAEPGRFNTSSLRLSVSAGESLPEETRSQWRICTGVEMLDGLGTTELIHIFIAAKGGDVRSGAIGKAVPGYEVEIWDAQDTPVPRGTVGRLAVRGPTGCRYLADARQRSYVRRGWNLTGDAALMDDDGYVFFQARTDDLIISSGYNIGAPEVESAVLTHEAVAECAVIGVPDETRGHAVKAFVVLKTDVVPSPALVLAIQDHVKHTIAPYKYPRFVAFVSELPRTETGKLQRFRLKESS